MIKRSLPYLLLCISLLVAYLVYLPGLTGYFLFDDTVNIVDNESLRISALSWLTLKQAAFSGHAGMLGRPVSMASFGLDYFFSGLSPYYFKRTNLFIHLLNGVSIFILSNLLLAAHRQNHEKAPDRKMAKWISLSLTCAWLLHPLNMSSVLYVVQRMTSLSSLFTLLGLTAYVQARLKINCEKPNIQLGWIWILICFTLCLPLAVLSKENGALLPLFIVLIEIIFFGFKTPDKATYRLLLAGFMIGVVLPFIVAVIYTALNPSWLVDTYKIRDFTMSERLMTEARIIWFYMRLVLVPDINTLGLYHDDILISTGWISPITTIPAIAGLLLITVLACGSIRKYPIAAFGVLFFLIGHSMESSIIPLELAHEHRNYLPMYGLLFSLFYYLLAPSKYNESARVRSGLAIGLILIFGGITFLRANQWGDAVEQKLKEVSHHPESLRSNMEIAAFYAMLPATNPIEAEEYYQKSYAYYAKASSLSSSDTLGLLGLIALNSRMAIPLEDSWTTVLANRIEHNPFAANTGNSLVRLFQCVSENNCKNATATMDILFQAAFRNPTLKGPPRIQLLFAWSDFLAQIKNDPQAAIKASYEAALLAGSDVPSKINLITTLVSQRKYVEARSEIEKTRKLDNAKLYQEKINQLEKLATTK